MTTVLTEKELRSQLSTVLNGKPARLVGLRSRARWNGGDSVECDGRKFEVAQVRSVLEFHQRVLEAEERGASLVCLTELDGHELGLDLLARLHKRRLHSVDPWTAVRHRFGARTIDANLMRSHHLARYLVDFEPSEGYGRVRGSVLTAEKAWSCLFHYGLGMPADYLDPLSLLQWTTGDTSRYRHAPDELKASARERVALVCGELGSAILACVDCERAEPLALGLVLRCIFTDKPERAQRDARVRLEKYLGDRPLAPELGREWASAAEHLVSADCDERALEGTRSLLDELQLTEFAHLSDLLPVALEQRLRLFGKALAQALDDFEQVAACEARARECLRHRGLSAAQRRRVEMAPRLLRWLTQPAPTGQSLGQLAEHYLRGGSFADWARLRSEGSLGDPDLAQAMAKLHQRVVERQEREAEQFAKALQAWNQAGQPMTEVMGVEHVLERVVVPLVESKGGRVLLIVLDGCSWASLHELLSDWSPVWTLRQPTAGPLPPTLATFPSVTEYSRCSLLSGKLVAGKAGDELKNLREHPALRTASNSGYAPALFHKGDLEGEYGLAEAVEAKILETKTKLVAVVLNAIDDHLERDDQIEHEWGRDSIKHLMALLDLAYKSGRTVVLASDHGHTLERGAELQSGEGGGARWQPGRAPGLGEVCLAGDRVLSGKSVVMAWSEKLRYTKKKNGYHGGAHPRELVAPVVVMAFHKQTVEGWVEVRREQPAWWDPTPTATPKRSRPTAKKPPASGQLSLFEEPAAPGADLAHEILEFPLIAEQWKQQKGKTPPREWTLRLLRHLEQNGHRATVAELSKAFDQPEVTFRSLLAQLGPLLTVDGIPVVGLTADAASVFLNSSPLTVAAAPVLAANQVEVETTSGQRLSFKVPLPRLDSLDRAVLEGLARYGQMNEQELRKHVGTRRVSGAVEQLMARLHKAGFTHLRQVGEGDQGRIYELSREGLGQ